MKRSVFFSFIILLATTACGDYENDPTIKLRSSEKLIAKEWKIDYVKYVDSEVRHSSDFANWRLTMNGDGTYQLKIVYGVDENLRDGSWKFIGPEEFDFNFTEPSGEIRERYKILRLTKDDFWIKNDLEEIHYLAN